MIDESRIVVIERQIAAQRRHQTLIDHWHDTMHSALYKRLWWWVQGYRLLSLGTWYRAPWNSKKYD